MAMILEPTSPKVLLNHILREIQNGGIDTWRYNKSKGFTHITHDGQWEDRAYLKPSINGEKLIFGIEISEDEENQTVVYGIYHGRFAEMLLSHFDNYFVDLEITSQLVDGVDKIA